MSRSAFTAASKPEAGLAHLDWAWFCLRSQQKHEQLAANCLRHMQGVEVFNPLLRFLQLRGPRKVWVTEALFPGYLFARFNWRESLTKVHYAPGVQGVVHFGSGWPTVPEQVINEIRAVIGPEELRVISDDLTPGDEVQIIGELFHGLRAVVTQVMPGRKRVGVLLEFLGRQTMLELSAQSIIKPSRVR